MKCFFVTDLHGRAQLYRNLFTTVDKERPDAVFLGGDLLPAHFTSAEIEKFLEKNLFAPLRSLKHSHTRPSQFYVIMGNDDPRKYEVLLESVNDQGLLHYAHERSLRLDDLSVIGYSCVPPTPFMLKDWERYDVSCFVDVGGISPEEGTHTVPFTVDDLRNSTIAEDLQRLCHNVSMDRAIFLFHSPPYGTALDRADLDGRSIDHAPLDVHVGSIAIRRFIEKRQPLLTLHGHIHEAPRLTGQWQETIGRTRAFSAAHDGRELSLIQFDPFDLSNACRRLIHSL